MYKEHLRCVFPLPQINVDPLCNLPSHDLAPFGVHGQSHGRRSQAEGAAARFILTSPEYPGLRLSARLAQDFEGGLRTRVIGFGQGQSNDGDREGLLDVARRRRTAAGPPTILRTKEHQLRGEERHAQGCRRRRRVPVGVLK